MYICMNMYMDKIRNQTYKLNFFVKLSLSNWTTMQGNRFSGGFCPDQKWRLFCLHGEDSELKLYLNKNNYIQES